MLFKIGFVIFSLGVMMGDSENLFVPVAVIGIGAALMYFGREAMVDDE